ncbi:ABC transporter permease [Brevibacillus laterosporus]|uniref:ABC transporter permease n=1 Tax=Brevibacillus laterosporus TaxID=1465 RepID=UPI003D21164C
MNKKGVNVSRNTFVQLILMNYRELVRDKSTFFFVLIFPFMFIGLFAFIAYQSQPTQVTVGIVMDHNSDKTVYDLKNQLEQESKFRVSEVKENELTEKFKEKKLEVVILMPHSLDQLNSIQLLYDSKKEDKLFIFKSILTELLRKPSDLNVVATSIGDSKNFNVLKFTFPSVLILAFLTLSLTGTAIPLIQMRQRGNLRLFAVTPINRLSFIASQILVRAGIAMIQLLIMTIYGLKIGVLNTNAIVGIIVVSSFGLLMFFSLGYMLGGILRSQEAVNTVIGFLMGPMMVVCGLFYPLEWMPGFVSSLARFIPLTYFGDGLRQFIDTGAEPVAPLLVDCLVMTGTAILFIVITLYTFKWDEFSHKNKGISKDKSRKKYKFFRLGG